MSVPEPLPGHVFIDPEDAFEMGAGPFSTRFEVDGRPVFAFEVEARHLNSNGVVHGGCLMTFLDLVVCATARRLAAPEGVVTVSFTGEFLAPARLGDQVEGRAEVLRATRSLVFLRALAEVDGQSVCAASAVTRRRPQG